MSKIVELQKGSFSQFFGFLIGGFLFTALVIFSFYRVSYIPDADAHHFLQQVLGPMSTLPNGPESAELAEYVPFALPKVSLFSDVTQGTQRSTLHPILLDLNGDGLMDYVFSKVDEYFETNVILQYVLLQTGSGFRLAYYCERINGGNYKGDCASTAHSYTKPNANSLGPLDEVSSVSSVASSATPAEFVPYGLPPVHLFSSGYNNSLMPIVMDINGDGLSDLVYSQMPEYYLDRYNGKQYVLLNTGSGFEKAYYCRYSANGATQYSGDCASGASVPSGIARSVGPMEAAGEVENISSRQGSLLAMGVAFALPKVDFRRRLSFSGRYYDSPALLDYNGDGLTDLLYSKVEGLAGNVIPEQYLLLGMGNGFRLGYYCKRNAAVNLGLEPYRGDCAQ
jgi:hypothetical protein